MKIQQTNNQPSFGLKVNINSRVAIRHGKEMLSGMETFALRRTGKPIGNPEDTLDLFIGSPRINRVSDKNDFRETYSIAGKAFIDGVEKKVNLTQSWLHSEGGYDSHRPLVVIQKYLEGLAKKPVGVKK